MNRPVPAPRSSLLSSNSFKDSGGVKERPMVMAKPRNLTNRRQHHSAEESHNHNEGSTYANYSSSGAEDSDFNQPHQRPKQLNPSQGGAAEGNSLLYFSFQRTKLLNHAWASEVDSWTELLTIPAECHNIVIGSAGYFAVIGYSLSLAQNCLVSRKCTWFNVERNRTGLDIFFSRLTCIFKFPCCEGCEILAYFFLRFLSFFLCYLDIQCYCGFYMTKLWFKIFQLRQGE